MLRGWEEIKDYAEGKSLNFYIEDYNGSENDRY